MKRQCPWCLKLYEISIGRWTAGPAQHEMVNKRVCSEFREKLKTFQTK